LDLVNWNVKNVTLTIRVPQIA